MNLTPEEIAWFQFKAALHVSQAAIDRILWRASCSRAYWNVIDHIVATIP